MFSKAKIQNFVEESRVSIYQLSKKVGVSHTTLGHIVYGDQKDMKLSTAFKLADVLGVDVNEFREGES